MNVWVECWELQCCGEPFAVGDEVEWGLLPVNADDRSYFTNGLGAEAAGRLTHCERHHEDVNEKQPVPTRGVVRSITAAYWERAPRPGGKPRVFYTVPGTTVFETRDGADGWELEKDGLGFEGYVVELAPVDGQ
jgi:hypothetical protein